MNMVFGKIKLLKGEQKLWNFEETSWWIQHNDLAIPHYITDMSIWASQLIGTTQQAISTRYIKFLPLPLKINARIIFSRFHSIRIQFRRLQFVSSQLPKSYKHTIKCSDPYLICCLGWSWEVYNFAIIVLLKYLIYWSKIYANNLFFISFQINSQSYLSTNIWHIIREWIVITTHDHAINLWQPK